jgi:hypothetical protein
MNRKLLSSLLALPLAAALVSAAPPSQAAEQKGAEAAKKGAEAAKKGPNQDSTKKAPSPSAQAAAQATLADQLVRYGDRAKDPLAMIVAARLMNEAGVQDEKRDKKTEGGTAGGAAPAPRDNSAKAVLDRAKQYAGARKDLIALADDVAKSGSRGALGGPKRAQTEVNARALDYFNVNFVGGETAVVAISGDGDTDLDLIIKDENGNIVCRSDGPGDDELCRWTPRWTGQYRIEVRNLGNVWNRYRIVTN